MMRLTEVEWYKALGDAEKQALEGPEGFTVRDVARIRGVTLDWAARWLQGLEVKGLVEAVGVRGVHRARVYRVVS